MVSRVIPVDAFDLVIFGGTGDLARRKILPGLYRRFWSGQMPAGARIIGASRKALSDEEFRDFTRQAISEFAIEGADDAEQIEAFWPICITSPLMRWARAAGPIWAS